MKIKNWVKRNKFEIVFIAIVFVIGCASGLIEQLGV